MDIHNLEEYISLVVDATVKTGIMRQMEAFRSGFNQVNFPLMCIFVISNCVIYSLDLAVEQFLYRMQWHITSMR